MAELTLFNFVLESLSVTGLAISAYFTYDIYRSRRLPKAWLAVAVAFGLIVIFGILEIFEGFIVSPEIEESLKAYQDLLSVIISILFAWGFYAMRRSFETYDVVERKVLEKVQRFQKKGKK